MAKDKKRELVTVNAAGLRCKTEPAVFSDIFFNGRWMDAFGREFYEDAFAREFMEARAFSLFAFLGSFFGEPQLSPPITRMPTDHGGSAKMKGYFRGEPVELDLRKLELPNTAKTVKKEDLIHTDRGAYSPISARLEKFAMVVHVATPCPDREEPEFVLWANLDKLSCPFCECPKNSRGRECFERGGYHEAFLPGQTFGTYFGIFDPTHVGWLEGVDQSYYYGDEERGLLLSWSGRTIETFPEPLNTVNTRGELEVFFLVPRVCFEKRRFYLWQYKPLNRFIPVDAFKGQCQICTGDDLKFRKDIFITDSIPFAIDPRSTTGDCDKYKVLNWDAALWNVSPFKCGTCHELSIIVEKDAANDLYNRVRAFKGKGLCYHCFQPVDRLAKTDRVLNCPRCDAPTSIYQRWNRETAFVGSLNAQNSFSK